jgi:hypothetical protein
MLENERERIRKGRQGFGIPGSLSNGKRLLTQQLMHKNSHKRKESQQGRVAVQNPGADLVNLLFLSSSK